MSTVARAQVRQRPRETLVLNADYKPFRTWPLEFMAPRDAVAKFLNGRVDIVETWDDLLTTPSMTIRAPKVVVCRNFAQVYSQPKFCRASVLLRDAYRCQYCGERHRSEDLTYDHVIPRTKGGRTEWTNIVMACVNCNALKGSGTHMKPLKPPRQPTHADLMRAGLELLPPEILQDFGSWLYWHQPLEP